MAEAASVRSWRWLAPPSLYALLLLALFATTFAGMASIWLRSDTYAHGFLILPLALYMGWQQRGQLRAVPVAPAWWVLLPLAAAGVGWLLARMVSVLVVEQFAATAMLGLGVWLIAGTAMARRLAVPLLFLLLAVPMGEGIVPPMMEVTATATVWLVKASGIPVFREGLFFTLPSGKWSVVEACSGVRYLIASFTLGIVFAYVTYQSALRRLLFILAAAAVPVLANILRAYLIVMIGHFSDMEMATGVDHFVYGWLFFAVVIALLFWVGSIWAEPAPEAISQAAEAALAVGPLWRAALAGLLVASLWPVGDSLLASRQSRPDLAAVVLPQAAPGWHARGQAGWPWQPVDGASRLQRDGWYQRDDAQVGMHLFGYWAQQQGRELVNSGFRLDTENKQWRRLGIGQYRTELAAGPAVVEETVLAGQGMRLLVWRWYRVGDYDTASPYVAKLLEAYQRAQGAGDAGARLVLVTPAAVGSVAPARSVLREFLRDHAAAIEPGLQALVNADVH